MSERSTIAALVIVFVMISGVIYFMIERISAVIGWQNAAGDWWVIALLVVLILVVALFIYLSVHNKLKG